MVVVALGVVPHRTSTRRRAQRTSPVVAVVVVAAVTTWRMVSPPQQITTWPLPLTTRATPSRPPWEVV